MTKLADDLRSLHRQILTAEPGDRVRLQPRIAALIAEMDALGEAVPTATRDLCEDITCDAIEAQFDNMPV